MGADMKETGERGGEREPGEEQEEKRWGRKGGYGPKCVEKEGDGEVGALEILPDGAH